MSYKKGQLAEQAAARLLSHNNIRIVAKNYRCRYGEIDIIALDGTVLCFIEVRYRRNSRYGTALETINLQKQSRIIKTAQTFLAHKWSSAPCACRFDVAVIEGEPETAVRWIRNAFELPAVGWSSEVSRQRY